MVDEQPGQHHKEEAYCRVLPPLISNTAVSIFTYPCVDVALHPQQLCLFCCFTQGKHCSMPTLIAPSKPAHYLLPWAKIHICYVQCHILGIGIQTYLFSFSPQCTFPLWFISALRCRRLPSAYTLSTVCRRASTPSHS